MKMEKPLSSFLKKPEQLNDIQLVVGNSTRKSLYKKTHIFIKKIIPNRVILDKNVHQITYINEIYHLDGFEISTENDKVMNVRVFGYHPNCDPDTELFCLPDFKTGVYLTKEYIELIATNIQTYYLDNCFFNPTGKQLRYEKMKSMYIQLNK
jgi:hypothetical protein